MPARTGHALAADAASGILHRAMAARCKSPGAKRLLIQIPFIYHADRTDMVAGVGRMANGFTVRETLEYAPEVVWAYLTNFENAPEWMAGIGPFTQITQNPLEIGTRFGFEARGKLRETRVTALVPGKRIALTSTQGGVTATYTYSVAPTGDGTEVVLDAVCEATGLWKLLHPIIVVAMRKSDSSQLANLKQATDRSAARRQ